jgi:hypothetical protein
MTKTSKKERRLSLFRYGSKAIAKYLNGDSSLYYCPICSLGYPESSAITGDNLTIEHVPPESAGGKPILLTCRNCNSLLGRTIDVSTANSKRFEKDANIVFGQDKGTIPFATLSFGDFQVTTSIHREDSLDIRPLERANSPIILNKYKKHLMNHSHDLQFNVSISHKYDNRLFKLSYLKSAFLLIFAWLGYRYAFDTRLYIVRQQLQKPESDILGTRFWIEGNGSMPLNKIMLLSSPLPILLVSFNSFCIILPSLESTGDTYDSLSRHWERGQKVTFQTKMCVNWPTKLQMKLDYS